MSGKPNKVFVVSAPSGTGKTTLNRRLTSEFPTTEVSVSYTTRAQRPGEVDGVHYHFVTPQKFRHLINQDQMLEFAEVFGTLYGTAFTEINRIESLGHTAILEIDVQGWRQAKPRLKNAVAIFILPPSIEILWNRLEARGTEPLDKRWRRLMTAQSEMREGELYDFFIINENLDQAYRELVDVVIHGRPPAVDKETSRALCQKLLAEFSAPWIDHIARQLGAKKTAL